MKSLLLQVSNEAFSAQAAEERAIWAHDKRMLEHQLVKLQEEFAALQLSSSATSQAAIESWDNERDALLDKIVLLENKLSASEQKLEEAIREKQKQQKQEAWFKESKEQEEVALQEQNQVG